MPDFTNFTLKDYAEINRYKEDFVESLNVKIDDPELKIKDLALMLRSLEVMENVEHLPGYQEFIQKIASKVSDFTTPTELIPNGGVETTYLTTNLVTNPEFTYDSFEQEVIKNVGFNDNEDKARQWINGTAYKFDLPFITEGSTITRAYTDGDNAAVAYFETYIKPNTQYKFTYDLDVLPVNWDLANVAKNMVDIPSVDQNTFSESGGGPDPSTYVVSIIEDPNLDPADLNAEGTQNHTIVPYHIYAREGDTIIFTNPAGNLLVHNAISDDNTTFTSPDLSPGETWEWVVTGYADLYYHCSFHPLEAGRFTATTDHRFVYVIDHGLNPGDTIKLDINYGSYEPLPNLSNSFDIDMPFTNTVTSLGGAGHQVNVESQYHNLSLSEIVAFQTGDIVLATDEDTALLAAEGIAVGERRKEYFKVVEITKGNARVDLFFNDDQQIGHIHTGEITPSEEQDIKNGTPTIIATTTDGDAVTGSNAPHSHFVTISWNALANDGAGDFVLDSMTGSHTHGLEDSFDIDGGTGINLINFGHYHTLIVNQTDEAYLKGAPYDVATGGGNKLIRTSDFGTSLPEHFHTVEFGCIDPANDLYIIIAIDQHEHDFDTVWYPGSSNFEVGLWPFSEGGDDSGPFEITVPITDELGWIKRPRGVACSGHGLFPGDRIHYINIIDGIHHGNTNYLVDTVLSSDKFTLQEDPIWPLTDAQGERPIDVFVTEEYTVVADLASYRIQLDRDITNHVGIPYGEGVQLLWSRPTTVSCQNHGVSVGDVVQLPSGPQDYTPSEFPGAMRDHTVVGLGDGYGPTEFLEITVDTQTTLTSGAVEGAQDVPWYWTWWDQSSSNYAPYERGGEDQTNLGGNTGTYGGFNLHRGGTYKFINNAWSPYGHIDPIDPVSGNPVPMYMHAAGIKAITGAGWDNLVVAGFENNGGLQCVSMRADHGLTLTTGAHNPFHDLYENPGNWTSNQDFPTCTGLNGWCEELDIDGWYYNGEDDETACGVLNPNADAGLAQWRQTQWIGNFSKEFTWKIPDDFGLSGSDGITGLGPFVAPGAVNGSYHVSEGIDVATGAANGLWNFDKSGMIEGTNRSINLYRGGTYSFLVNSPGFQFYLTTDDGTNFGPGNFFGEFTLGVNGSRASQGPGDDSGDAWGIDDNGLDNYALLEFTVPVTAPDTLYYQEGYHDSMVGQLNIVDIPVVAPGEDVVVYFHHGQDNMYTPLHILDKILVDNGTSDDFFEVSPTPEYAFPVAGTQDAIVAGGNNITATGPGTIPDIQAMNIEFGTQTFIPSIPMIQGVSQEQFLVSTANSGIAQVYLSVDQFQRSQFTLANVRFEETPWTEGGTWNVGDQQAYTTINPLNPTQVNSLEQIVLGNISDGLEYELSYDIVESFKDDLGAEVGFVQGKLIGGTIVTGLSNTLVGSYTETLVAPVNTSLIRLDSVGAGKIDNVSLTLRVAGSNAWYFGEGWSADSATASSDGSVESDSEIKQEIPNLMNNALYEVSFDLAGTDPTGNGANGELQVSLGGNTEIAPLSAWSTGVAPDGSYKYVIRAGTDNDFIRFIGGVDQRPVELDPPYHYSRGFTGNLDNISIREVDEQWTFASQAGGIAEIDTTKEVIVTTGQGPTTRGLAHITFNIIEGETYKVAVDADGDGPSAVRIGPTPDNSQYANYQISGSDTNTHHYTVFIAPVTGVAYLTLTTEGDSKIEWDNISIRNIPDLASEEYMLLGRAVNVFGIPLGSEDRWEVLHNDSRNLDYRGLSVVGMRTLESFGENVMESYYSVAAAMESTASLKIQNATPGTVDVTNGDSLVYVDGEGFTSPMIVTLIDSADAEFVVTVNEIGLPTFMSLDVSTVPVHVDAYDILIENPDSTTYRLNDAITIV